MKRPSDNRPAAVLTARWREFLATRKRCLKHDDLASVHDLRVATRRLRAALKLFKPLAADLVPTIASSIRRLTREVGHLRNLDEALVFFERTFSPESEEGFSLARLLEELQVRRKHEARRVRHLLKQLDVKEVQRSVDGLADLLPDWGTSRFRGNAWSWPVFLSRHGLALFEKVRIRAADVQRPEAVEQRHALRIAIKRWRYFLEILAELTGQEEYALTLENLKRYQSLLGHLNDLAVFADLVAEFQDDAEGGRRFETVRSSFSERYLREFHELSVSQPLNYVFLI